MLTFRASFPSREKGTPSSVHSSHNPRLWSSGTSSDLDDPVVTPWWPCQPCGNPVNFLYQKGDCSGWCLWFLFVSFYLPQCINCEVSHTHYSFGKWTWRSNKFYWKTKRRLFPLVRMCTGKKINVYSLKMNFKEYHLWCWLNMMGNNFYNST